MLIFLLDGVELFFTKYMWYAVGAIVFVLFIRLVVRILYVFILWMDSLILLLIVFL